MDIQETKYGEGKKGEEIKAESGGPFEGVKRRDTRSRHEERGN